MCSSVKELIDKSDIIIVGNYSEEFKEALTSDVKENQVIIDLIRIVDTHDKIKAKYYGICW